MGVTLSLATTIDFAYSVSNYLYNKKIPLKGTVGRLAFWFQPTNDFTGTSNFLKLNKPTGWNFD